MPDTRTTRPTHLASRAIHWIAAASALVIALSMCALTNADVTAAVHDTRVERLNAQIESIYTDGYQSMADDRVAAARDDGEDHDADNMVLIDDPYGTNTTSLYVYFTTDSPSQVSYTVAAEGYPDFTRTAKTTDGTADLTVEHEFLVIGLVPGERNTITFTIRDSSGGETTKTIERRGPKLRGNEATRLETTVKADEGADLGDGLYAILGNDSNEQDFMFWYDTDGVLRGEIPVLYYRSHRLLFDDDGLMWFSASTKHFVGMNRLGKLEKIINLGDKFILHHDYQLDADGNIVSLATELGRDDHAVQDQVIKVDVETGEVTRLVDFGEIFPEYKASTDHSGIDESDPTAKNRWDWIHFNTIQLMDDGSAVLSARETSTIIKIADIEGAAGGPSVEWMIGEPSVWDGFEDDQALFLAKDGDFADTGGQHSITVVDDDLTLADGQYYLYMFDNNFGHALTRPDFDWTVIDGISTSSKALDEGSRSQYRRYLIDENAGTYREVSAFDVPYSPYVSSAQELEGGNILIDSGQQGLIGTYAPDGTLLAQYRMALNTSYIYRVYQYDFEGFFFG